MAVMYQQDFNIGIETFAYSLQYSTPFDTGVHEKLENYHAPVAHTFQRITSTILLFLIGLGIRNELRIG